MKIENLNYKFGNTVYPTLVISEKNSKYTFHSLNSVSKTLGDFLKHYGEVLKLIAKTNPRKVEDMVVDGIRYYFIVSRLRDDDCVNYVFQFVYMFPVENEIYFPDVDFKQIIYDIYSVPSYDEMCSASHQLLEYVNNNRKNFKAVNNFLCNRLIGFFENRKTSYFYKINDVIKYTVLHYFSDALTPCKVNVNYIESDMYTQMDLNKFLLLIINLLLVLSRYSLRKLEIDFENNVTRLETYIKCSFHNSFFMGNTDIEISELCELKYSHPAFMDFQFIKCLANTIGVEVSLGFKAPGKMIFRISVSKADVVFSNLIKCSKIGNIVPDIPIYTTDLEELILKN